MLKHVLRHRRLDSLSENRLCAIAHELGYRFFECGGAIYIVIDFNHWLDAGVALHELEH